MKLSWYKSDQCCNCRMLTVIPMVTTKKTAIENTHKEMIKEFKPNVLNITTKKKKSTQ